MGLRIINPSGETTVIQPFTGLQLKQRTVQLWCNVKTQEHNLIFGKAWRANRDAGSQPDLTIEFSIPFFRSIADTGPADLIAFSKKIKHGRSLLFSPVSLRLDAAMHPCIYQLTQYDGDDSTKRMFLYARVIDLLLLQQQSYIRANTPKMVHVKNEYDKERIVFARDYLLTHMDAPPGLIQLAAIAGINEFKLKRGFKELFGNTVFGYLADVRLEMARRALHQKQKTVTQIAFELGYASLQHFSAAFKKKFGVSPAKLA
jgi:AraC family transcriptional activator of pyochelin receptor